MTNTQPSHCYSCGIAEPITRVAVIQDGNPDCAVEWALCDACWNLPSRWTTWRPAGEFAKQKRAQYVSAIRLGHQAPPSKNLNKPRTETGRKKRWTAAERRARREHDEAARLSGLE